MDKINILHLEDNKYDAELIQSSIENSDLNIKMDLVKTESGFINAINEQEFNMILADYSLPSFNGMAALEIVKKNCPNVPFIFVTGAIGEETAIETLKAGAVDYVLKNNLSRLVPAIKRALNEAEIKKNKILAEEKSRKYDFIINTAEEFMTLINRDYIYEAINDSYCKAHNKRHDEIIGKKVEDLWGSEVFNTKIKPYIDKCFNGKISNFVRQFNFGKLGNRFIDVSYYPFSNKNHIITHVVVISKDVTEKEIVKKEREKLFIELEKTNKDLKESTNQLIQAEKLSTIGELTSSIIHEMNQPLNTIKIISQSLLRDMKRGKSLEKTAEDTISEIINQIDKISQIIDHMRIYSRNTKDEIDEEIDINMIIEKASKFIEQHLLSHNIKYTKHLKPQLPKIIGNSIRLEQVLFNIINNAQNAVEQTDSKQKKIDIKTDQDGLNIEIEISDNGIGITEDIQEKIFQPFFTTKGIGKGTGLGLSIVKKIIQDHKGQIELQSKVNVGTTFRIFLPAK